MQTGMDANFWKGLTNPYDRKARLYPAFLALLPALGVASLSFGVTIDPKGGFVSLLILLGGLYFLSNLAREFGKRCENALYASWGGKPSTQLQRHSNGHFDAITKARFHAFLGKNLDVPFPTVEEERADAGAADQKYAAGTTWLLDHTRDRQRFSILFAENVSYGYRRNSLGLKPLAIAICLGSIVWVLASRGIVDVHGAHLEKSGTLSNRDIASLLLSFTLMAVWLFYFTKETVKTAAFAFADALLRTCTVLETP